MGQYSCHHALFFKFMEMILVNQRQFYFIRLLGDAISYGAIKIKNKTNIIACDFMLFMLFA